MTHRPCRRPSREVADGACNPDNWCAVIDYFAGLGPDFVNIAVNLALCVMSGDCVFGGGYAS